MDFNYINTSNQVIYPQQNDPNIPHNIQQPQHAQNTYHTSFEPLLYASNEVNIPYLPHQTASTQTAYSTLPISPNRAASNIVYIPPNIRYIPSVTSPIYAQNMPFQQTQNTQNQQTQNVSNQPIPNQQQNEHQFDNIIKKMDEKLESIQQQINNMDPSKKNKVKKENINDIEDDDGFNDINIRDMDNIQNMLNTKTKKTKHFKTTKTFKVSYKTKKEILWTSINAHSASLKKLNKYLNRNENEIKYVLNWWSKKGIFLPHGRGGLKLADNLKKKNINLENDFINGLILEFGDFDFMDCTSNQIEMDEDSESEEIDIGDLGKIQRNINLRKRKLDEIQSTDDIQESLECNEPSPKIAKTTDFNDLCNILPPNLMELIKSQNIQNMDDLKNVQIPSNANNSNEPKPKPKPKQSLSISPCLSHKTSPNISPKPNIPSNSNIASRSNISPKPNIPSKSNPSSNITSNQASNKQNVNENNPNIPNISNVNANNQTQNQNQSLF